jgi:hypothetical protein
MGEHRLAGGSVTVHAEFGDGSEDGCIVVHASSVPRATTSLVPIFVAAELGSATLGPSNGAEVIGQLVDVDVDVQAARAARRTGVTVEPVLDQDAQLAGAMRSLPGW